MPTATSSNCSGIGADGLCTVTSTVSTRAIGQAAAGQPLGQPLDQVDRLAAQDRSQRHGQLAVVHRVGDVVRGRRGRVSRCRVDVDGEGLAVAPLVLVHAVEPEGRQPRQQDPVERGRHAVSGGLVSGGFISGRFGSGRLTRPPRWVGRWPRPGPRRRWPPRRAPDPPGPGRRRQGGGRRGGGVPVGRRRAGARIGDGAGKEPLARGAHQHRPPERRPGVEVRQQPPGVLGLLGEAEARDRGSPAGGRARPRLEDVEPLLEVGHDLGDHVVDRRPGPPSRHCARFQCIATNGTPERAATAAIPGSARPPLMSLTIEAPPRRAPPVPPRRASCRC